MIEISDESVAFLEASGHGLVTGGPGCGKTTLALLKAKQVVGELKAGQGVLFLSFSRAAVRQILDRSESLLTRAERRLVQVRTYHRFSMQILQAHARLLNGRPARFLPPGNARLREANFEGDWETERRRLAAAEGIYCFDEFAPSAAELITKCSAVRELYADRYPFLLVDEFQDTDDDQWRLVHALAGGSEVTFLADPEQRIFEYRPNVSPKRIQQLREELAPRELDLGSENHRSPGADILRFADCVLRNQSPPPDTTDVRVLRYRPDSFEAAVHAAVVWAFSGLRDRGIGNPTVAVLARSNWMVEQVSAILSRPHSIRDANLQPVSHEVEWDAELSSVAGQVIGSILEWPGGEPRTAAARTARLMGRYYRLKGAETGGVTAAKTADKLERAASDLAAGKSSRIKAAKELLAAAEEGIHLVGDPVADWLSARNILDAGVADVQEVARAARMVRLFRATDALAEGLSGLWGSEGNYAAAAVLIRRTLERERLIGRERKAKGCVLMNFHKSKGKEFDGVVMVEGQHRSPFFNEKYEDHPFEPSRRILRVAMTRARHVVTMVRPHGARPLVD